MTSNIDRSPWAGQAPDWDEDLAQKLRGAYVLVGISYLRSDGMVDERVQLHGRVSIADRERGIGVALEGKRKGETFWLPADLLAFEPAPPGDYRLHGSGEIISNPDFTSTWKISRASDRVLTTPESVRRV